MELFGELRIFAGNLQELNSMGSDQFMVVNINTRGGKISVIGTSMNDSVIGPIGQLSIAPHQMVEGIVLGETETLDAVDLALDQALRRWGADGAIRYDRSLSKVDFLTGRRVKLIEEGIPVKLVTHQ